MAGIWPDKMSNESITETILNTIQEYWGAGSEFSISELLEQVDSSDRTLRRQLKAMVDSGILIKTGGGRSTRYSLSESNPSETRSTAHPFFSESSEPSLGIIRGPIHTRKPVSYEIERLHAYTPNDTFYLPETVRKKLNATGSRDSLDNQPSTYIKKIFDRLLVDLSYNSSRLEGNTYSINETSQLILEGKRSDNKADAESTMILNHKEAVRKATEIASAKPSPNIDDIKTIHFLLSEELVNAEHSGEIRSEAVGITRTTYSPIDGKDRLNEYLELILAKAGLIDDAMERSLFLLLNIAYLQPFIDVNKRTSRLACIIPLLNDKKVPLTFLDIEPDDYAQAMLAFYELGDTRPASELFAWGYERSCEHYDAQIIAVGFNEVRASHRPLRREFIRSVITELISADSFEQAINSFTKSKIKEDEQSQFISDTFSEIQRLTHIRTAGMGVTKEEFDKWHKQCQLSFLKSK